MVENSRAREVVIRFPWREGFTIPVVPGMAPRPRRAASMGGCRVWLPHTIVG